MLQSIRIKNFRSFDDVTVPLGNPVIAFVGRNGVGKTNLLHAIAMTAEFATVSVPRSLSVRPRDPMAPISLEIAFTIDGQSFNYSSTTSLAMRLSLGRRETLSRDGDSVFSRVAESLTFVGGAPGAVSVQINPSASTIPSLLQLLPLDAPIRATLDVVNNYLSGIRYYPLSQTYQEHRFDRRGRPSLPDEGGDLSSLVERSTYDLWLADPESTQLRRSVQLRLLHLHLTNDSRLDELRRLLGDDGLGVISGIFFREIKIPSPRESDPAANETAYLIRFRPGTQLAGSSGHFPLQGLSAGTARVLNMLTSVLCDERSCMLVEQPEDSIHPGLLEKVIDILGTYSHKTQLICTTHSPTVMNCVGSDGVRLVQAQNGVTSVTPLSETQMAAAKQYLNEQGTLAEFLDNL